MRGLAVAFVLFCLTGCAYIGEPLPPALKIPERVTDLRAIQRGDRIYVDFSPPKLTTEGLVIDKLGDPDLRIGDTGIGQETSASPWVGQTVEIRVRFANSRGRVSEWSNVVKLLIVSPLTPPVELRAEMTAEGARIDWKSSAPLARVYRDGELLAKATAPYLDTTLEWGKTHDYAVQGVQPAGDAEAESGLSSTVQVDAVDRFPPATPTRFTAIAGISSIELSWERNGETDFAFYRLYRDGKVVADKLAGPSFSDTDVHSGISYRYAVTAVDQLGNESAMSSAVEIVFP